MTPFGRQTVSAGLLAAQMLAEAPAPLPQFDKWELFRALCRARVCFGISDRDLTVLNALLTFHKPAALEDAEAMVVFPSNKALAERAHGMAESTLRRHLAALVKAGLVLRHDSPNGKRFARRGADGTVEQAFGFDLRPLLVRAQEIMEAGERVRVHADELKRLRETCVLVCRDAVKLLVYGKDTMPAAVNWDALDDRLRLSQRALRRKLDRDELETLKDDLEEVLRKIQDAVMPRAETKNMSGKDAKNERHQQNSSTETYVSEPSQEIGEGAGQGGEPPIPLVLVLKGCGEIQSYRTEPIESWDDLVRAAEFVRGMMGISPDAWEDAVQVMGAASAAVTLACMLERMDSINVPGGYLRALTQKAALGAFSTGPMVMALLNGGGKQAA